MRKLDSFAVLLSLGLGLPLQVALGQVIINELMYHPPGDSDQLQYVELYNRGQNAVELSAWSFDRGISFEFPTGAKIDAESFLVVCQDRRAFADHYSSTISTVGNFSGRLSHKGETIRLKSDAGDVVDEVTYLDRRPWSRGADGYGPSLERISPAEPAKKFHQWAGSKMGRFKEATGTPGRQNDSYSSEALPFVFDYSIVPEWPRPDEEVMIQMSFSSSPAVERAILRYRVARSGGEGEFEERAIQVDEQSGSVTIPGQASGSLVRFQILLESESGKLRTVPSEDEPRPAFSYFVGTPPKLDRIGHGLVINVGRPEQGAGKFYRERNGRSKGDSARGDSAFVYYPDENGEAELFDFIRITQRHGGFKLRFHSDAPLDGMTVLNVLNEGKSRYLISEFLSFELFRRIGVPSPRAGHLRFSIDGRHVGHFLTVEQTNRSFLKRNDRNADGNLYKILWFGRGVVDQHEKKTNRHEGHDDVQQTVAALRRLKGGDQWRYIQQHFNVAEFASYFAGSMCVSNWDGFFNNYFTYHDISETGKWEIYPWDQDKTWGDYDGAPRDYSWYQMPLTFGMNGDRAPSQGFNFFRRGPFGGTSWWRPPGYFSGPLLANDSFRRVFLDRLRTICHSEFNQPRFLSVIDALEQRLLPEVAFEAGLKNRDQDQAKRRLREEIESFRRQLKHRRTFILSQLAKQ